VAAAPAAVSNAVPLSSAAAGDKPVLFASSPKLDAPVAPNTVPVATSTAAATATPVTPAAPAFIVPV
jgi:hypothetical protein